jgi:hypothetical protein
MSSSLEAMFGVKKKEEQPPVVSTPPAITEPKPAETKSPEKIPETTPVITLETTPKPQETKPLAGISSLLPEAPKPPAPVGNPLLASGMSVFQKQTTEPIVPLPTFPKEYDMEPEKPTSLKYLTIFGGKNSGKTVVALSFPGKMVALSFDHKTVPTWVDMFNSDPRITIYDAIRYMDYSSPDASLISSEICFRYIFSILDMIKSKGPEAYPDWILIDGLEEYMKIAENVMRWRNGIKMTQGVEWMFWKDRRLYTKQLFLKLAMIVKKGVIFCTKYDYEEIVISGVTKERTKKPIWLDIIEEQTDIVIETWSTEDKVSGVVRFLAHITASKYASFPTGRKVDVTADAGNVKAYELLYKGEK